MAEQVRAKPNPSIPLVDLVCEEFSDAVARAAISPLEFSATSLSGRAQPLSILNSKQQKRNFKKSPSLLQHVLRGKLEQKAKSVRKPRVRRKEVPTCMESCSSESNFENVQQKLKSDIFDENAIAEVLSLLVSLCKKGHDSLKLIEVIQAFGEKLIVTDQLNLLKPYMIRQSYWHRLRESNPKKRFISVLNALVINEQYEEAMLYGYRMQPWLDFRMSHEIPSLLVRSGNIKQLLVLLICMPDANPSYWIPRVGDKVISELPLNLARQHGKLHILCDYCIETKDYENGLEISDDIADPIARVRYLARFIYHMPDKKEKIREGLPKDFRQKFDDYLRLFTIKTDDVILRAQQLIDAGCAVYPYDSKTVAKEFEASFPIKNIKVIRQYLPHSGVQAIHDKGVACANPKLKPLEYMEKKESLFAYGNPAIPVICAQAKKISLELFSIEDEAQYDRVYSRYEKECSETFMDFVEDYICLFDARSQNSLAEKLDCFAQIKFIQQHDIQFVQAVFLELVQEAALEIVPEDTINKLIEMGYYNFAFKLIEHRHFKKKKCHCFALSYINVKQFGFAKEVMQFLSLEDFLLYNQLRDLDYDKTISFFSCLSGLSDRASQAKIIAWYYPRFLPVEQAVRHLFDQLVLDLVDCYRLFALAEKEKDPLSKASMLFKAAQGLESYDPQIVEKEFRSNFPIGETSVLNHYFFKKDG